MTTLKQLAALSDACDAEADALAEQSHAKQEEAAQYRGMIGERLAKKLYGLKVGDVIEHVEMRGFFPQKPYTYRLRIASFSAGGPNDTSPNICGHVLTKEGTVAAHGRHGRPRLKTLYVFNFKKMKIKKVKV